MAEEQLRVQNVFTNLTKCELARVTMMYLGQVVGQGTVCPVKEKVQAVTYYYRSFCEVVAPLTNLLKADVTFVWSFVCQQAFERVKMMICNAPVLAAPRFDRPFSLQVDISHVGAGAVLLQEDDFGIAKCMSFFSKKFNS